MHQAVQDASPKLKKQGGFMSVKIVFEFLGIAGSLIICGSVIPQVIRTYRTKSARDLSITYLATLMTGIILLTVYSVYIRDLVFIFGNILSLLSIGILIGLWKRYCHNGLYAGTVIIKKEETLCLK
jgi:MtN3 and saliva related transmembrane protein